MLIFSLVRRRRWSARRRRRAPSWPSAGSHPSRCELLRVPPAGLEWRAASNRQADRSRTRAHLPVCDCTLSPPPSRWHSPLGGSQALSWAWRPQVERRRRRRPLRGQLQRPLFGDVAVARYTNGIRSERQIAHRQRSFSARLHSPTHQHQRASIESVHFLFAYRAQRRMRGATESVQQRCRGAGAPGA